MTIRHLGFMENTRLPLSCRLGV